VSDNQFLVTLTKVGIGKRGNKNMLDQLVESKNNSQENRRKMSFILVIGVIATILFSGAWLRSLFAKELGVGSDGLELSSLVTPVPLPESEPPKPEPVKQEEKQQTTKTDVAVLKDAPVQDISESPTDPPKIQTTKSDAVSRNKVPDKWVQGDRNVIPDNSSGREGEGSGSEGTGRPNPQPTQVERETPPPTPPPTPKTPTPSPKTPPPTEKPTPPPPPKTVSGGVVNGKATNLVKPAYPPAAKAVGAKGQVSVSVTIDENGNVISASASGGHPLLQPAAVAAARSSKFSPTMLSGQKVKVTGVIIYNFQ
jgi:TonB family protein